MKSQMKSADRSGAAFVLIVGSDEASAGTVVLRSMRSDAPQQTIERAAAVATVAERLSEEQP